MTPEEFLIDRTFYSGASPNLNLLHISDARVYGTMLTEEKDKEIAALKAQIINVIKK